MGAHTQAIMAAIYFIHKVKRTEGLLTPQALWRVFIQKHVACPCNAIVSCTSNIDA